MKILTLMDIDPHIAQFVGWMLGFLFTALVGIIVYMAKSVVGKINKIVENQETDSVERTVMKKDIDTIKSDISAIEAGLNDLPNIKERLIRMETKEENLLKDVHNIKDSFQEIQNKVIGLRGVIQEQEKFIAILKNQNK